MRYPGDADAGAAPGGQERLPGRPGLPWPRAADDDQPSGRGENPAGWYSDSDRAGVGSTGDEHAGGWYSGTGAGDDEQAAGWFADGEGAAGGNPGDEHAGGWYADGGYADAGYGYGDNGYGGGQEPGAEPVAGFAAADVTTAAGTMPAGAAAGSTMAAGSSPAGGTAEDRVLIPSDTAQPGSVPPGSAFYGTAGGTAGKGPVRGYPPAPGQAAPVYPPGQFSAWNQTPAEAQDGRAGRRPGKDAWPAAVSAEHGYAEPDYPVLAVSDPAADATATQTWAVAEDHPAGSWRDMSARAGLAPGAEQSPAGRRSRSHQDRRATAPVAPDQAGRRDGVRSPRAPGAAGPGSAGQRMGRPATAPPGGPAPRPARGPARGRRGRKPARRGRVLLAAGLAVVVAAATGTYFYLASGHRSPSHGVAAASNSPAATQPEPSASPTPTGRWGRIQTRKTDPQKLTLHQLFPVRFTSAGSGYSRTAVKAGKHCSSAVLGSKLQSAISAASCSQVMRASYLAGNRKLMGTIGVLNLKSARLASRAGKATGPSEFIAQLRGAKGPTRRLTKGTGIEEAEVKGHYLILIWAEFASLHAPKTKAQKKELVQFCTRLLKNTANVSLSRRLVTGKP
jgi:hypothetical protein